jgi:RNA polymerase sigma factor (sigma-70 family)
MKNTFETLLKDVSVTLRRISYRAGMQARSPALQAEDLYQEAVLFLWNRYMQGAWEHKTRSYILQGCYFHLKNFLRTHMDKASLTSLEACVGSGDTECSLEDILSEKTVPSAFDTVNASLIIEAINNNGLTDREKQVFRLSLSGLTVREIGSRLGVSHVRVVKLRKTMQEKCRTHLDAGCYQGCP